VNRRPIVTARLVVVALCVALSACSTTEVVCTTLFAYGISVRAVDASTGQPVTVGLTGTLSEGGYRETMQVFPTGELVGAGARAGTYVVSVTAAGYQPWTQSDVRVGADECHVQGVHLDARLTRLP
jgi:hypothetical protein